jgi:nucleoside phosphorylase
MRNITPDQFVNLTNAIIRRRKRQPKAPGFEMLDEIM